MKRVSSSVPSLEQRHGPVSHRESVARRQRLDSGPWHIDLQVSRRLSRRPVVPSLFRPTVWNSLPEARSVAQAPGRRGVHRLSLVQRCTLYCNATHVANTTYRTISGKNWEK